MLLNKKIFVLSAAEGVITSIVLFFIPYGAFYYSVDSAGKDSADHQTLGVAVASILVVIVNLRVGIKIYIG